MIIDWMSVWALHCWLNKKQTFSVNQHSNNSNSNLLSYLWFVFLFIWGLSECFIPFDLNAVLFHMFSSRVPFCPLLVLLQSALVLDDQVIFCLTVSLDKLPVNTLKAKVRHPCIYTNRVGYCWDTGVMLLIGERGCSWHCWIFPLI